MKKLVAVFGPGDCRSGDALYAEAEELGRLLAISGFAVVTGGYEGVMEAASKGAREGGGPAIGITAEVYFSKGREPNPYLTREVRVKSATDRLMELLDLADAWCAIGNSTGTLAEVAMAWDYMTKGFLPRKPLLLLGETWSHFLTYVRDEPRLVSDLVHYGRTPEHAIEALVRHFGPQQAFPELEILK